MLIVSGIVGRKTGTISAQYNLLVTPPGAFFAIWGIIYTSLVVSGFYFVINDVWSAGVMAIFAVVCILNGLWIYFFSYGTIISTNICTIVLIVMAVLNGTQWALTELKGNQFSSSIYSWNLVNRNILAFYQGWLVAAANLNIGMTLVYSFGVSKQTQAKIFWVMCPLCIIGMIILNLSFR